MYVTVDSRLTYLILTIFFKLSSIKQINKVEIITVSSNLTQLKPY